MKICPAELAEVCREETSLGRPLASLTAQILPEEDRTWDLVVVLVVEQAAGHQGGL